MQVSSRFSNAFFRFTSAVFLIAFPAIASAAVYTVTNSNTSGTGSLRQAIVDANATPDADEIHFSLPGSSPTTITLSFSMTHIADNVLIDGTTQPGYSGSPIVMISAVPGSTTSNGTGLNIDGANITLRGLAISNFADCIEVQTGSSQVAIEGCYLGVDLSGDRIARQVSNTGVNVIGIMSDSRIGGDLAGQGNVIAAKSNGLIAGNFVNNVIAGNRFGVSASGDHALLASAGISNGITLNSGSHGNAIRGSMLGGVQNGIVLNAGANGNTIQGNLIGLTADGTAKLRIGSQGIEVFAAGEIIGGSQPSQRNVISGCANGLNIMADSTGTLVQGNYFGLGADGMTSVPNALDGIALGGSGVKIGGDQPGEGNVICGGNSAGILVNAATNGIIQGNTIGLSADQTVARPHYYGIYLGGLGTKPVQHILIGGLTPLAGNVIAADSYPIYSIGPKSSHHVIQGNLINVNRSGKVFSSTDGINIFGGTTDILIGGTQPGAGNVVTNAANRGVQIRYLAVDDDQYPQRITVLGNLLYGNLRAGIDLYGHHTQVNQSPNDPGDLDDGPNGMQNYPVLTAFSAPAGADYSFTGMLDSLPNKTYLVELYCNASLNPIHLADQEKFIARFSISTGADGIAHFTHSVPSAGSQYPGGKLLLERYLTMTATDPDGNTSEISPQFDIVPAAAMNWREYP